MTNIHPEVWRKSSYSMGGGNCVEIAHRLDEKVVAVRDSKDRSGPVLTFPEHEWAAFVAAVRADQFGSLREGH